MKTATFRKQLAPSINLRGVLLVPLLLLFVARTYAFEWDIYKEFSAGDSPSKTITLVGAYSLAAVIISSRIHIFLPLFARMWAYLAYVIYALTTMAWSGHPDIVLMRIFHMIGLALVAACAASWARGRILAIAQITMLFSFLALILSVSLVVMVPERGLTRASLVDIVEGTERWVGVTYHPNLLGGLAFVAVWSSVVCFTNEKRMKLKIPSIVAIVLAFLALKGSESRSAAAASILFIILKLAFSRIKKGEAPMIKNPKMWINTAIIALVAAIPSIFLFSQNAQSGAVREGADDALSGRPEIWNYGIDAFIEKPYGWTFDLLQTYWDQNANFNLFPHFHNGFLDVAVKGGVVGLFLFLLLMSTMAIAVDKISSIDFKEYNDLRAFAISILVYNLTETALDRENLVWNLIFVIWCCTETYRIEYSHRRRMSCIYV